MKIDGARISVSLATVTIEPADGGAELTYTEQGAHLDGLDTPAQREAAPPDCSTPSAPRSTAPRRAADGGAILAPPCGCSSVG